MLFLLACSDQDVTPEKGGFESAAPIDFPDDTDPVDTVDTTPVDETDSPPVDTWRPDTDPHSGGYETGQGIEDFSDCDSLREAPWDWEAVHDILYWEDFAFDKDGSMLTINGMSLIRQWLDGTTEVIFPMFGDSRGHLPIDGDRYIISSLNTATFDLVGDDGSREQLATGAYILAITVDDDRWAYFDDYMKGGIGRVNLDTYDEEVVAEGLQMPDGIVWDSRNSQLYVVENYPSQLTVVRYDESEEEFEEPETVAVLENGTYLDGVTVDHCGNVYIADATNGLYRYVPELDTLELLTEWPTGVYTPSVHFGEGYGDFETDHLFVMDYNGSQLFEFDAQVKGRPNPYVDL